MSSKTDILPRPEIIEKSLKKPKTAWQHLGRFHIAAFEALDFSLRRYDFVMLGIETCVGEEISLNIFQDKIRTFVSNQEFEHKALCLIMCVHDYSQWSNIEIRYPINLLLIELSSINYDNAYLDRASLYHSIVQSGNISILNPFEWNRPCTDNMFFGRQKTLNEILQNPQVSFAIVGPRRVGKTSLLYHIRKKLARFSGQTFVFINCFGMKNFQELGENLLLDVSPEHYQRMAVSDRRQYPLDYMLMKAASTLKTRYVIALDEFDELATSTVSNFESFRALVNSPRLRGRCRFIVSGYSALWHHLQDRNSHLFNLFRTEVLGPFTHREGYEFATVTMGELGVSVAHSNQAIERLLEYSGNLPWLLQALCSQVILEYTENPRTEAIHLVDQAAASYNVKQAVFESTTMGSSPLGNVILSYIAEKKGDELRSIYEGLKSIGLNMSITRLDKELGVLRIAGAIIQEGMRYRLCSIILKNYLNEFWSLEESSRILKDSSPKWLLDDYEGKEYLTDNRPSIRVSDQATLVLGNLEHIDLSKKVENMTKQEKVISIGKEAKISAPVIIADTIESSFNTIMKSKVDDDIKTLLKQLLEAVNAVNEKVPKDKADEAEMMVRDADVLVKEATSSKPRRQWYEVSIEGLKQAAINIGEIADPVLDIVKKLSALVLT